MYPFAEIGLVSKAVDFLLGPGMSDKGMRARTISRDATSAATQGTVTVALCATEFAARLPKEEMVRTFFEMCVEAGAGLYAWDRAEHSSVWATARSVQGVLALDSNILASECERGTKLRGSLDWLEGQRNADGGFGFQKGLNSRPIYAYFAAQAFLAAHLAAHSGGQAESKYLRSIQRILEYFEGAKIEGEFLWPDVPGGPVCPASTMFVASLLRELERRIFVGTELFPAAKTPVVRKAIEAGFEGGRLAFWHFADETAVNWRFEEFLPGRLSQLLEFFEPTDPLIVNYGNYLLTNVVSTQSKAREWYGWGYEGSNEPITWITALAVNGISMLGKNYSPNSAAMVRKSPVTRDPKAVFVVYGRNERVKKSMFEFLRALKLAPVEWNVAVQRAHAATSNANPYIGDILRHGIGSAQACLVLLTPDEDVRLSRSFVRPTDSKERSFRGQPRPNVIFEAGLALADAPDRTIVLEIGDCRSFSDVLGRYLMKFNGAPGERHDLKARLRAIGCDLDDTGQDWLAAGDFDTRKRKRFSF